MSILLEALKKSEAERRLGAPPTLGTPDDGRPVARNPRGMWLTAAMLALAVVAMSWVGLRQFRPPANTPVAVSSGQDAGARAGDAEAVTGSSAAPQVAAERPGGSDSPAAAEAERERSAFVSSGRQRSSSESDVEEKRRLLRETYRGYASRTRPGDGPIATDKVAESPPEPALAEPAETADLSTLAEVTAAAIQQEPDSVLLPEETISYWQIPASLRDGMPELRIRVLVYADRPEDRFLLINDKRLREGEELESGLRLEEIRRDRAVFTYRNYRFHLKG